MANGAPYAMDFWDVLDEAEEIVERWPSWQRRVEGDVFGEHVPVDDEEWWAISVQGH
ncbi:MAG TPA: hypothetical protein VJ901_14310 [Thermoanaerobaculia bacterium]|nr:hypothetical protein [Thermoanaerobaculia bacterium]